MFDILTHNAQMLDQAFTGLKRSPTLLSDWQRHDLEKLGPNINRLCSTLARLQLSGEHINRVDLHDVRNEISIVSTRAQLLYAHNAGELDSAFTAYLDTIVNACDHLNIALTVAAKRR